MQLPRRCAIWLAVLGLCLMCAPAAQADLGGFTIRSFDVELEVQPNADLIVTERIVIHFSEPRRGIYREIPTSYTDPVGFQYGYGFRLFGVEDEHGAPLQVKQSRSGSLVRLRIGDPDRRVSGTQVYVVRYRARDVLRQFGERDELYWNVTGHRWNTTIDAASVVVRLPGELPADELEVSGWAGAWGSRDGNVRGGVLGPGQARMESTVAMGQREGLTVAVTWPRGIIHHPGALIRVSRFLARNVVVLVPILALVYLVRRYRSRGVDPQPDAAMMVRYEPPAGVSPGAIGTLVDERVGLIDITATIVDLAVRGYLTIRTERHEQLFGLIGRDVTSFTRNHENSAVDLLTHERRVLDGIFSSDAGSVSTEDLKEEFYTEIPGIRDALYERLVELKLVDGNPEAVRRKTVGLGVVIGVVTGVVGMLWGVVQGAVFPNAAALPVGAAIATALMFGLFAPAMPRRTRAGVRTAGWARGFEEFAGRVEADRMERDAARDLFEKLLPYAMALGVATQWSRKFEGIYADRAPGWFVGSMPHNRGFSTIALQNGLDSAMSETGKSLASTPRSSGSSGGGGGGFSGGGGGGGGGGSW